MNRRAFIKSGLALGITVASSFALPGLAANFWDMPRTLWMKRGREEARVVYWERGRLNTDGYRQACILLRDVRAGVVVQMDPVLLDILCGMQGWLSTQGIYRVLDIHSGYRTPRTNARTEGAALHSKHMEGSAGDVSMPDVPVEYMGKMAQMFSAGGVGFYFMSKFVHVDRGRVRAWYR